MYMSGCVCVRVPVCLKYLHVFTKEQSMCMGLCLCVCALGVRNSESEARSVYTLRPPLFPGMSVHRSENVFLSLLDGWETLSSSLAPH